MENYDRLHAGTRKLSPAVGFSWFYSSEPAPFSDDQSHLGAQWRCGRGPVRPSKLQGSGKDVVRAEALKDTALDRLGSHDHQELVSVVGWLESGSHAAVVDPGNGIIAQSGRDVVLPKRKAKAGEWMLRGKRKKPSATVTIDLLMKKPESRDGKQFVRSHAESK